MVFKVRPIEIRGVKSLIGPIMINEFQVHIIVMVLFASIIAPFGGFFASGLKRALQIKDFGDIIPGHGGVVDRFDCMNLMMIFISLYLSEIIKGRSHSINSVS